MNYLSFLSLVASVSLLVSGCSKAPDKKTANPESTAASAGSITMQVKWIPGRNCEEQLTLDQTLLFDADGTNVPVQQVYQRVQSYTVTVLNTLPDGGHDLQIKFGELRLQQLLNQQVVLRFDTSAASTNDIITEANAKVFQKIPGSQVHARINARGKIVSFSGVEDLVTALGGGNEKKRTFAQSLVNEEIIRQFIQLAEDLPEQPVRVGGEWPRIAEVPSRNAGTLLVNLVCHFSGWEQRNGRHCAVIKFDGDFKSQPAPNQPAPAIAITSGRLVGTTWFDCEAGVVVDTFSEQDAALQVKSSREPVTARMVQKNAIRLVAITSSQPQP